MAIYLVLAITIFTFSGLLALRIVFSLFALSLGASTSQVGAIIALVFLCSTFFSYPVGILSDRYGPRGLLSIGALTGVVSMLIPVFVPSVGALYVAAVLVGVNLCFAAVIGQSLIGELSQPHERTRNFANYSMTSSVCSFVGPLIAGFTIDNFGYRAACATVAFMFGLSLLSLAIWGHSLPKGKKHNAPRKNLRVILSDRRLWKMFALNALVQHGQDLFGSFIPLYGHQIGLSASVIGVVMATFAVAALVIRFGLQRMTALFGDTRVLAVAFFVGTAAFLLVPLSSNAITLSAAAVLFGFSLGICQPLTLILMYNTAAGERAGEAIGLRITFNNLVRITGPAVFGWIGATAGLAWVFWITAGLLGLGGRYSRATPAKPETT